MAEKDIIQNMISRLGQSQDERSPPELDPGYAPVDGRSGADLLALARSLAPHIRFYRHNPDTPSGDWSDFFPASDDAALLEHEDGQVAPHLALYAAFLRLYEHPRAAINRLTAEHMDFQYRRVLAFAERRAVPDRAHLLVELKKITPPLNITTDQAFTAGKDASGVELLYRPVREVVVGQGRIAALKSVYRSGKNLRFAPIANSADGLGGELDTAQPLWHPFGHAQLPTAQPGFAIASPVLRMAEGTRVITLDLTLASLLADLHAGNLLADAFEAYLTGPKGWLGPHPLAGSLSGSRLSLTVTVPDTEAAVVDYDVALHGQSFAAQGPVLHLQLRDGATLRYGDLAGITLVKAQLGVQVDSVRTLTLESDAGALNPKSAFLPFGAQPVIGAHFMVGCQEALSKRLLDLQIKLTWKGAPSNLYAWYQGYSNRSRLQNGVSARIIYQDRSGQSKSTSLDLMARVNGVSTLSPSSPAPAAAAASPQGHLYALMQAGSGHARMLAQRQMLAHPIFMRSAHPAPTARSGFVIVQLEEDFLHADYRKETIQNALNGVKTVLDEPYTPTLQEISLDYQAQSDEVDIAANSETSFGNLDLQFFHVGCFGQMREHGFLRSQFAFVQDKRVSLLPSHPHEGEFLLGLGGLAAGDSVSLLLQVAEGSADPELPPQALEWSVLCDNYWRVLTPQELVLDSSNGLRASGVLALTLPRGTTTDHTFMPAGMVWLRAVAHEYSRAACQMLSVSTNAVEVQFVDQGNDPAHLAAPLPAGSIAKLKVAQAPVKAITQPYASFGGRMPETVEQLRQRAAERLRHRDRCITPWDYERMVLENFPAVHKVKCIPHAKPGNWLAPGHMTLVVIPDLRNRNAVDPLRPRADIDTLARIARFVQGHCGMQVQVAVKNPFYQRVRLDFRVRMHAGYSFSYYSGRLREVLMQTLTPWAFVSAGLIDFGGRVYRSMLIDVVEELYYVDFVSDFKLQTYDDEGKLSPDLAEIAATAPDAILVSDAEHGISEITDA
jgi:hypothetical protein